MIFKLLWIELFKISKRPRTYISFIAIFLISGIFQFAFKADGLSYLSFMLQNVESSFTINKFNVINGSFICYLILNTLLIQVPILVALISGDSISGEANMGTLRLIASRPISRAQIIIAKFLAAFIFTVMLLLWMAVCALLFSILIFGTDAMLVFRTQGDQSSISQIADGDIMWRYICAFAYAIVALTVIAALAMFLSIFADNSIGPIIMSVCIVIVCTIISNMNIPIIDKHVRPYLFTSYLVGWKGFFYIDFDENNKTIKGSIENWPAIRNSLFILIAHIFAIVGLSIYFFRKKDILS